MHTYVIPAWIWINLALLVVVAVFVAMKVAAAEKSGRQKPLSRDFGRAIK